MDGYDVIVVGGGSAGSVLASRLSEDAARSVLLLEAGGPDGPPDMRSPQAWSRIAQGAIDWDYVTTPQEGLGGRVIPYPRGRVLGGSSAVNAMMHIWPQRANLDAWVAGGARGWGPDDLLPCFRRTETVEGGSPARGTAGPMRPAPAPPDSAFSSAFVDVLRAHPRTLDAARHDLTIVDGRRQTAADAYLTPEVLARPNLSVRTGAMVHRLLLRGSRCTGLLVESNGRVERVDAAEVVVSGGAIGSPHLLLRSGIGPAAQLRGAGVDVLVDLPAVGAGLKDHPLALTLFGPGPEPALAVYQFAEVSALLSTGLSAVPDVHVVAIAHGFQAPGAPGPLEGVGFTLNVVTPDSTGSVRLSAPGPGTPPLIDPNLLGDERDVQRLLYAVRVLREIVGSPELDRWRGPEWLPGVDLTDDASLTAFLRATTGSYWHPFGTCRLGVGGDSVVDLDLRVHEVDGLRVADASVFPGHVSANTNATVLAVAEKAAELIAGTAREVAVDAAMPEPLSLQ